MSKINSAESLRGLACMAVVFSHLSLTFFPFLHNFGKLSTSGNQIIDWFHHSPFGFLFSGTSAVFVFFVLSGYVLSYAILNKDNIPLKVKSMILKRYPRLAIPAGISCAIAFMIISIEIDATQPIGGFMKRYGETDATLLHALYEGFIGSFLFGYTNTNWVLWTMQIELIGSIILFLLLLFYYINKRLFIPIAFLSPLPFILISVEFCAGIYAFIFGCFIYLYGKKISTIISILILIIGLYFAGVHYTSKSYYIFAEIFGTRCYIILNFLSGILIVYSVLMSNSVSEFLDKKPLVKLGTLSFSIYLLHLPIMYLVAMPTFNLLLKASDNYGFSAISSSLIFIAITLIFSKLYSKYVDLLSIKTANNIESMITIKDLQKQ